MQILRIRGGKPLEGMIHISGAKNAALPVLAACVLFSDICRVENCPDLLDVDAAVDILEYLGAQCVREGDCITVDPRKIFRWEIPARLMQRMRGSVFFLGPLMARFGRCTLAMPGGCPLGKRPVDYHVNGLQTMGAVFEPGEDILSCRGKLMGKRITLPYPSVGATENLLMAALGASSETTIENTAREPEICCLCDFLRSGGCRISGDGTSVIRISPGLPEKGEMNLIPDRMETATYLCAAASAGGRVRLENCCSAHLDSVIEIMRKAGCVIACEKNAMTVYADGLISPGTIETGPYPAFPTDAQAPLMAAVLKAKGECCIRERVFSQRMHHIPALQSMGAMIQLQGMQAVITGRKKLFGAKVRATDLRGGAALMVAALGVSGETEISGLGHLLRGYEDIAGKLRALGADCSFG